jgi:Ca-activated chloride channel family protein
MWLTLPAGILKGEEPAGFEQLSAREAVRQGNQLLIEGNAPTALEAYEHAEGLRPDALEIPFVQGLGHYALKQYESAREVFEKAAVSRNRRLADDATYSVGTTYHAEALEGVADPQLAIEKLENAMQRYQSVLANQPDHPETRDAMVKAASMRRQLKQMLEQQQQQQQNQDQDQQDGEENPDDQQQQQGQDQNEQEEQQQSEAQQQPSDESQEQQDQQQSAQQDEQQEEEEQQQVQESEAEREEQTSREQAQRRLREMMQNIRERQKRRREEPQPYRVAPVDKDW